MRTLGLAGIMFAAVLICSSVQAEEKAYPEPFWSGTTLHEDPVLFTSINGSVPEGALMTKPVKILKASNLDGKIQYKEGVDFEVIPGTAKVRLLKKSKIPYFTEDMLYPPKGKPRGIPGKVNSDRNMFWCRDSFQPSYQIRFTYTHNDKELPRPGEILGKMPKTFEKIRNGKPIVFAVYGDSISQGYNASKFMKFAPFEPMHYERFAAYLEKKTGAAVKWYNRSQGGRTAGWANLNLEKLFADVPAPDFIFVAWGMNDITAKLPVETFVKYLRKQMDLFKAKYPETEFVVMTTMYANKEWSLTNIPEFEVYRKEVLKLADDNGILIVDQTKIWEELLKRKDFMSLSGNGLNHPNDFGHRVYADVMINTFERGMSKK